MPTPEATVRSVHLEEIVATACGTTRAQARELLLEYGRWVIAQPGAARFCFGTLEKEAERLPQSYFEQGGGCMMACVEGHPAGFAAWRMLPDAASPDLWELKRLWVRPTARGLGLGRALTRAVTERAPGTGCRAVYLDTAAVDMAAPHRMYVELGFTPCAAYVVHGTADKAVPFAQAKSLARRVPSAETPFIEGGDHVSLFTHLHEIRSRVTQFLSPHVPSVKCLVAADPRDPRNPDSGQPTCPSQSEMHAV